MTWSRRLLTWNLFFSASAYERRGELNWNSVRDLVALIDSFCLFDQLVVVGEAGSRPFLTHETPFFEALREHGAVIVRGVEPEQQATLIDTASKHLALFLGEEYLGTFEDWLAEALALNVIPPDPERQATMNRAVRQRRTPLLEQPSREHLLEYLVQQRADAALRTFVTRAFMYYALSEMERLPFVPDVQRAPLLEAVVGYEQSLMEQLRQALQAQWEQYPRFGNGGLRRMVSPFAAVVFQRANRPEHIPEEMLRLRNELKEVRREVGGLEAKVLYGTRDEASAAEARWDAVLAEVERAYGPSPHRAYLRRGLEVLADSAPPIEGAEAARSWMKAFIGGGSRMALRWWDRRPVVHLHRLRRELPATGRLRQAMNALFPKLT